MPLRGAAGRRSPSSSHWSGCAAPALALVLLLTVLQVSGLSTTPAPMPVRSLPALSPAEVLHPPTTSSGCGGTPCSAAAAALAAPAWSSLSGTPSPSARIGAALAYDSSDGYTVLFGGYEGYARPHHDLNDTWILRAGVWQLISPPVAPSPRQGAAFAAQPGTGCL
ncbi:MAG: hypothetical protein L3J72_04300, partial [Thermoplasmata archaeon]|nr:hypothetical protein [Thermoplasmata archaeon]